MKKHSFSFLHSVCLLHFVHAHSPRLLPPMHSTAPMRLQQLLLRLHLPAPISPA